MAWTKSQQDRNFLRVKQLWESECYRNETEDMFRRRRLIMSQGRLPDGIPSGDSLGLGR